MLDKEWVSQELRRYQDEEIAAIKQIQIAKDHLTKAKADLAAARETLTGVRGCILEFNFQMKCLKEHGELP
jgi:hypothetical protein